jgi:uncharacterized protein YjiS (DUF1127 family)
MPIREAQGSRRSASRPERQTHLPQSHSSTFAATLGAVGAWMVRSGQRKALRDLAQERRLLNDIGLTREQALREAAKPFWRR